MFIFLLYFFIYAFLGWVIEVVYHAIRQNKLVNRGFLNGAICPIYGIGMLTLILSLEAFENNILLLFLGTFLLCSFLELVTGFLLEVVFHQRWWDYSDQKFNVKGYICLKFSIIWGLAGTFAIVVMHNIVSEIVGIIPHGLIIIVVVVLIIITMIDIGATIIDVVGLNKDLTNIDEMGEKIKAISDEITNILYNESIETEEKYVRYMEQLENKRHEMRGIKSKLENKKIEIIKTLSKRQKRLLRAFPNIKSLKHRKAMEDIKLKLRNAIK